MEQDISTQLTHHDRAIIGVTEEQSYIGIDVSHYTSEALHSGLGSNR